MPPKLFKDILSEKDPVIVMLEHIEYFLRLEGKRSSFTYAAQAISRLDKPLSALKDQLREIKDVGEQIEETTLEILETKDSSYYESLS